MSMEQNQLTRDLYAAGYTREDHPSFVYWSDWQNFGYLFEALLKFTWETPCGLLIDGKSDLGRDLACCDASFQGIDYCPENDNPLLRCPYERKDCPHSISGFPVPLCPCHTTGKRYSYEQSAERVESERSERQHRQYMEITGGAYCACVVGGNGYDGGHVEVQYDVEQCIRCRCQNPVCVIRKQKRDLSRANIFYDVRRTWITRIGFLEEKKVQVTKGERVFPHPVARTDAEIWLEMKKAHFNPLWSSSVIDSPHLTPEDRRQTFFSKMHRRYGEYDYFEFHYDVENIRIAASCGVTGVMQPFVRSRRDLETVRQALDENGGANIRLFAKIENQMGLERLPEFLETADEIVIARGDLGNAMPLWELPAAQKRIEAQCRKAGKPFMVVTQMLASMEQNPVPTRAEVSDIFNAVADGAAAVMVTGETAVGKWPVEVIRYLSNTVQAAERFLREG